MQNQCAIGVKDNGDAIAAKRVHEDIVTQLLTWEATFVVTKAKVVADKPTPVSAEKDDISDGGHESDDAAALGSIALQWVSQEEAVADHVHGLGLGLDVKVYNGVLKRKKDQIREGGDDRRKKSRMH